MEDRSRKLPTVVAVLLLAVIGTVLAYLTNKNRTVSPLPEQGLRIIFMTPMPTEIPTPTASVSATPRPSATPKPRPTGVEQTKASASVTPKPTTKLSPTVTTTP